MEPHTVPQCSTGNLEIKLPGTEHKSIKHKEGVKKSVFRKIT
jgi:hypothetical protein